MAKNDPVTTSPLQVLMKGLQDLASRLLPFVPARRPKGNEPGPTLDVLDRLRHMRLDLEQATVRLGIIGESGSGKSSLINAIVGREVAPVGALIETTQQPQEVPVEGLTLVDLPGCGTPTWPRDSYVERLKLLDSYDGFILVTAHRLKECDAHLYDQLARKAERPFFVVRSHFDLAVAAHGEEESRRVITPHICKQLGAEAAMPVYMVSSVGQTHYDLEKLILDVRAALPEWKQVRFMLAARAYGVQTLARKREAAEKVIGIYAGLSAANALNPVPGLDIGLDIGLLTSMSRQVIAAYGLTPQQMEAMQGQARLRAANVQVLRQLADRLAPYLTQKFIISVLRRLGMKVAVKESAKWVPYVGVLVSAGVGYQLAYRYGEQLIDECEEAAREVVQVLERETADGEHRPS